MCAVDDVQPPALHAVQPLTEEETKERDTLLTEGFGSWTKREFSAFVRGCERHGRTALPEIAKVGAACTHTRCGSMTLFVRLLLVMCCV